MNNNAIGESWEEVKKELFSPEEIIEIDASAALMEQLIEARQAQGISQKRLEELSGVIPACHRTYGERNYQSSTQHTS